MDQKEIVSKPKKKRRIILWMSLKINRLKSIIIKLFTNSKTKFASKLIIYSIAYGIPINYMLWGIFGVRFGLFTFPAFGVLWYLLNEELPFLVKKFIPDKR